MTGSFLPHIPLTFSVLSPSLFLDIPFASRFSSPLRSDNYWDSVAFLVDLDTPASVFEMLEAKLKRFLADQPREFSENCGVNLS